MCPGKPKRHASQTSSICCSSVKKDYNRHILTSSAIMAMSAELLVGIWTRLAIGYDWR